MKLLCKLSKTLPIPELRRVAWQRRMTERAYEVDIRAAKAKKDGVELESLRTLRGHEVAQYDEEEALLISRQLLTTAAKLDIQRPSSDPADNGELENWEYGEFYGRWALSPLGRARLREDIRKERKARHEDRIYWLAWIAPLTGIIGAATGLVAVLAKAK